MYVCMYVCKCSPLVFGSQKLGSLHSPSPPPPNAQCKAMRQGSDKVFAKKTSAQSRFRLLKYRSDLPTCGRLPMVYTPNRHFISLRKSPDVHVSEPPPTSSCTVWSSLRYTSALALINAREICEFTEQTARIASIASTSPVARS